MDQFLPACRVQNTESLHPPAQESDSSDTTSAVDESPAESTASEEESSSEASSSSESTVPTLNRPRRSPARPAETIEIESTDTSDLESDSDLDEYESAAQSGAEEV